MTVLFTSVGRRVELIRHFLEYASAHPEDLSVLGTEIDPFSPAAQVLKHAVIKVPRADDPAYLQVISDICHERGVNVIFPLIDPDVYTLGTASRLPLASVGPDAAVIVSDKWLTYQWLNEHGIPTVESWLPGSIGEVDFPLFIKPRRGSGGVDAFQVNSENEFAFFSSFIDSPIVQRSLSGSEITVDVVVGARGEVLATAQRMRLAIRGGEVSRGMVVDDPEVTQIVGKVVTALQPSGPITVQGMYASDGSFRVTEINARMGGGIPLAVAAGVPVARLLVDSWLGREPEAVKTLDVGLHMVRFDDSLFYRP
ncbi:ATP-grasp domain-containing protein [Agrococcus sp. KRD186]|uniref:ATP-grasp domain-containing protein n=1 Tax=Agrococcus sp. KRD186 TaxID=2729730 RepID=UPI0019D1F9E2|nr:ATP-grasp domain-containing protein [Agrococcus sp. KRD186]